MPANLAAADGTRISPRPYSQITVTLADDEAVNDAVTNTGTLAFGHGAEGDPFDGVVMSAEADQKGAVAASGRLMVRTDALLTAGTTTGLVIGATDGNVKAATAAVGNAYKVLASQTISAVNWAIVESA